jgi:hypothetical protein
MGGMFSKPKVPEVQAPPEPKVVRMPTVDDPNAEKAASRFRKAAMSRKGRRSSILTDNLREATGSSGSSLGG